MSDAPDRLDELLLIFWAAAQAHRDNLDLTFTNMGALDVYLAIRKEVRRMARAN